MKKRCICETKEVYQEWPSFNIYCDFDQLTLLMITNIYIYSSWAFWRIPEISTAKAQHRCRRRCVSWMQYTQYLLSVMGFTFKGHFLLLFKSRLTHAQKTLCRYEYHDVMYSAHHGGWFVLTEPCANVYVCQIFVQARSTITLNVEASDSVESVKALVAEREGVCCEDQRLVWPKWYPCCASRTRYFVFFGLSVCELHNCTLDYKVTKGPVNAILGWTCSLRQYRKMECMDKRGKSKPCCCANVVTYNVFIVSLAGFAVPCAVCHFCVDLALLVLKVLMSF